MGRLHAVGQVSAPFCLEGTSASLSDLPALQFAMVSDPITAPTHWSAPEIEGSSVEDAYQNGVDEEDWALPPWEQPRRDRTTKADKIMDVVRVNAEFSQSLTEKRGKIDALHVRTPHQFLGVGA